MEDVESQVRFVAQAIPRIISQIDFDPVSPTYGCAHLAYWRDKTSDVADMRRQEAMLPLALVFTNEYPGSQWRNNGRLKIALEALLAFWCRNQYADGSLDEWYKGERAYAAAAFSTHAVARTLAVGRDWIDPDLDRLAREKLHKTSAWLIRRNDLFKTNHQAVGAAALAWAGHVLDAPDYTAEAHAKLDSILQVQTTEGWFPEVGHMDVGYTFLTVEFAAMAMHVLNNWSYHEGLGRAFDFASEWVHPDMTLGEEYGVCHNTYVSRIAAILMSPYCARALYLRRRLEEQSVGFKGYQPVMADDLRLLRWSFQPLLAYDYARESPVSSCAGQDRFPLANCAEGWREFPDAGLTRISLRDRHIILAVPAGGLVRFFHENGEQWSEHGYVIRTDNGFLTNVTYNPRLRMRRSGEKVSLECPICKVKRFTPPFWARVVLRLACATAPTSRWTRRIIDIFRARKGTAINQSSVNLSSNSGHKMHRTLELANSRVVMTDKLTFDRPTSPHDLYALNTGSEGLQVLTSLVKLSPDSVMRSGCRQVTVTRIWDMEKSCKTFSTSVETS